MVGDDDKDGSEGDSTTPAAGPYLKPAKGSVAPKVSHGISSEPHTLHLHDDENGWDYVDATQFNVRGHNYLKDKVKIPSQPAAFELAEFSGFSTHEKLRFASERPDSYYARARAAGRKHFMFVMHFDLNPMHVVLSFENLGDALEKDTAFATCWKRFLEGDDSYKNKRIKLITSIVEASWIVRKTVGKPVPALIGNKLKCFWRQSEDLLECTCEVTSSMAASAIVSVIKSYCRNIICDLVILLEGQKDDELPERIIGCARAIHHDLAKYQFMDKAGDKPGAAKADGDAAAAGKTKADSKDPAKDSKDSK
mmetsp:Transcript_21033/g.57966  ORF Transcript_21033/g.57966 Transcript_21033/m.57966 type:complete len:309 (-) Transcript_21033:525-1451(-)